MPAAAAASRSAADGVDVGGQVHDVTLPPSVTSCKRQCDVTRRQLMPSSFGDAVVAAGRVAAVDGQGVARTRTRRRRTAGTGRRPRSPRAGRSGAGRAPRSRGSAPPAMPSAPNSASVIGVSMNPGQMAFTRMPDGPVVDGQVLGEQHHAALRRVVGAAARGALEALDAGDGDDRAALAVDAAPGSAAGRSRAWPRGTCR